MPAAGAAAGTGAPGSDAIDLKVCMENATNYSNIFEYSIDPVAYSNTISMVYEEQAITIRDLWVIFCEGQSTDPYAYTYSLK